jgi:hypothetical protein
MYQAMISTKVNTIVYVEMICLYSLLILLNNTTLTSVRDHFQLFRVHGSGNPNICVIGNKNDERDMRRIPQTDINAIAIANIASNCIWF